MKRFYRTTQVLLIIAAVFWPSSLNNGWAAYIPASPDPCANLIQSTARVNISAATNTQIITGTSGKQTYICAINLVGAAADNVAIVEGTGTACATGTIGVNTGGTTAASGWNFAANGGIAQGIGLGTIMGPTTTSGGGANVCVFPSAATQLTGVIKYVQQ